jgi:DNA-binding transcriptional ArsR family regulator
MTNALAFAAPAFSALADPTRREVFEHLARGPQAVGELAQGLPVSRPAVSQHLKVLKEAGLVTDRPDGTRRVYQIDPQGLGQIRAWLDRFWDTALDAFKAEAERAARETPDKEKGQP